MSMLSLRYDSGRCYRNSVLQFKFIRANCDGPINPPILEIADLASGERFSLTADQTTKLLNFITNGKATP